MVPLKSLNRASNNAVAASGWVEATAGSGSVFGEQAVRPAPAIAMTRMLDNMPDVDDFNRKP